VVWWQIWSWGNARRSEGRRSPQWGLAAESLVGRSGAPESLKQKAFFVFGCPKGGAIFHLTSKFRIVSKSRLQRWCWTAVNTFLDFSFLCRPIWGNSTVSPFPLVQIVFGGMLFPQQDIWGNGVPPRSPSTIPLVSVVPLCDRLTWHTYLSKPGSSREHCEIISASDEPTTKDASPKSSTHAHWSATSINFRAATWRNLAERFFR